MKLFHKITLATAISALAVPAMAASLGTSPQPAGDKVLIDEITADQPGFVVIHMVQGGEVVAPASIGHTQVAAGDSTNIEVMLTQDVTAGDKIVAMLHTDTGVQGTYEFGPGMTSVDLPVTANGAAVTSTIDVEQTEQQQ